jgi:hypothetical protein
MIGFFGSLLAVLCLQGSAFGAESDGLQGPYGFQPSMYRIINSGEFRCSTQSLVALRDGRGNVLSRVCPSYRENLVLEGTGLAMSAAAPSRRILLNFIRHRGSEPLFAQVDENACPFGLGVANGCLVPFMTVAADLRHFRPNDVIFVPMVAAAKIQLLNGDFHPGYFVVKDLGGSINGSGRFDFFVGATPLFIRENPFFSLGFGGPCRGERQCKEFNFYKVSGVRAQFARDYVAKYLDHLRSAKN